MLAAWLPASIRALQDYSARSFWHDVVAGVTVGLVALPLAMAFAIASGLSPQAGIYCAIVTGFMISALGGSRVQIGGPTGAFVVVVAGIVAKYGVDGLFMCTMMAGVMLVVLGVTGMGAAVRFIPRPVVVGFTNGIAVLIASTQIRDFLGLRIDSGAGRIPCRASRRSRGISTPSSGGRDPRRRGARRHRRAAPRRSGDARSHRRAGGRHGRGHGAGASASKRSGPGSAAFPPACRHRTFRRSTRRSSRRCIQPALTVAMLGAIESLMSAVVADRMSGDRHNPNVELVAQGIANIASPLFGGLPATGAIARTATNIRSGARTPVAGHRARAHAADRAARGCAARQLHPDGRARAPSCWSWPTTWANGTRSRSCCG